MAVRKTVGGIIAFMLLGIGAYVALLIWCCVDSSRDGYPYTAQTDIRALTKAVQIYKADRGELPSALADLVAHGYYDFIVDDPWGRPYEYSEQPPRFGLPDANFYIWTSGEDGVYGDTKQDGDFGSWQIPEKSL